MALNGVANCLREIYFTNASGRNLRLEISVAIFFRKIYSGLKRGVASGGRGGECWSARGGAGAIRLDKVNARAMVNLIQPFSKSDWAFQ